MEARTSTRPPSGVNFTALDSRFSTTCLKRRRSASSRPTSGSTSRLRRILCLSARSRTIERQYSRRFADGEFRAVQDHLAGLDLRQVENVVQQFEQMLARAPDVAQVVVLTLVELAKHALQEHFRKADDGVQRCTQLVRHTGQEFRLVPARDFECGALPL